ncbi:MAG: hypothetical protein OXG96_13360 [Acidobacteria bacterium]|nr:hypothetical protein [Acidobacteriota bacterium]
MGFTLLLSGVLQAGSGAAELQPTDPEAIHMFPLGGQPGSSVEIEILGRNLEGAHALWADTDAIQCRVVRVEPGSARMKEGRKVKDIPGQRVVAAVEIDPGAERGPHALRLVSARGVSNELIFWVVPMPTLQETDEEHGTAPQAQAIAVPSALSGRIADEGQADFYRFEAHPDQELAFEVVEGVQRLWGDLRRAAGFTLELSGPAESWFDAERRVKLGAANTAVLHKFISAYKPRLIHRFAKGGSYTLEVKGEPGASYQLQIGTPADFPPLVRAHGFDKLAADRWQERGFNRRLEPDRLSRLQARSGGSARRASLAVMEKQLRDLMGLSGEERSSGLAAAHPAAVVREREPNDAPPRALPVAVPSIIEGTIGVPADVDHFRFELEEPRDLAFEIETPDRHYPYFNPRIEVFDQAGRELVNNIYKRQASQNMWFWKTAESKMVFSFPESGSYLIRVRDVTRRKGGAGFRYRLMVRPQVPHVGEVEVAEVLNILGREMLDWMIELDRVNLYPGEAKKVNVIVSREEGFAGDLAVTVDNLPEGVEVLPGADMGPELGLPQDQGRKEVFAPEDQVITLLLAVRADAPPTAAPRWLRFHLRPVQPGRLNRYRKMTGEDPFRPIWAGQMGPSIPVALIPMMVLHPSRGGPAVSQVVSPGN